MKHCFDGGLFVCCDYNVRYSTSMVLRYAVAIWTLSSLLTSFWMRLIAMLSSITAYMLTTLARNILIHCRSCFGTLVEISVVK